MYRYVYAVMGNRNVYICNGIMPPTLLVSNKPRLSHVTPNVKNNQSIMLWKHQPNST
ncbi:hypothetical protein BDV39DRAFT_30177 [Aspergillus sergii]|uniref:Uncharacterized protein n=1 Tax=Aspergillus sergii TaxID=1034303 RepID=A0A5N6WM78_9EURO|nr:hypothetical protein BDV39DRAFT_30177 [Aspergillus sergii]